MLPTSSPAFHRQIVVTAALCAVALIFLMTTLTLVNGTGYQDFESLIRHGDIDRYMAALIDAGPVLRLIYPLDTLYILAYVAMTFAVVWLAGDAGALGVLAMLAACLTGLLDFVENNHILAMLTQVERGYGVSVGQVTVETVITQIKFNAGLLLTLVLSFLIPADTRAGVAARWLARVLVLVAPAALLTPATTFAYISMNLAFAGLIAAAYWPRRPSVAMA